MVFHKRMNRIEEVMEYDKKNKIPSVFFFGMDNVLGMSYTRTKAKKYIRLVKENGFDVGVHGCEYKDYKKIQQEYNDFQKIAGLSSFGIRTHYVRYDERTFEKFSQAGYLFDSSYFNKKEIELVNPTKIGGMWEFPLHVMDGYICFPGKLEESIDNTCKLMKKAEQLNIRYFTILFHDYQFDNKFDPETKEWYEKIIEFCNLSGYEFISYRDAIKELNNE